MVTDWLKRKLQKTWATQADLTGELKAARGDLGHEINMLREELRQAKSVIAVTQVALVAAGMLRERGPTCPKCGNLFELQDSPDGKLCRSCWFGGVPDPRLKQNPSGAAV